MRSVMIAVTLVASVAVLGAGSAGQAPTLTLVSTAWPPFTNPHGQPRFALDLVEAGLRRIGLTVTTTMVNPAQFTMALLGEQYDGSAAVWKDEERQRVLVFSRPYLENRLVLVGRHGADVTAATLAELNGKRIALVEGYAYSEAVERAGPMFVRSASEEDSLARLLKEQVEYTLMDELVVQYIVSSYPKESAARLQIGSTPLVKRELHFAIRRSRTDAQSIVDRFNEQLRRMIVDGTYHELLHVDWLRADVNGDGVAEYVPRSQRAGTSEPQRAYLLFSPAQSPSSPEKPGFYVGGNIYRDWATVPDRYKAEDPRQPDARRSTASIFRITW
jgi:polar amino acid transport system substrate-binding protein